MKPNWRAPACRYSVTCDRRFRLQHEGL
jgi:hypothetical protein